MTSSPVRPLLETLKRAISLLRGSYCRGPARGGARTSRTRSGRLSRGWAWAVQYPALEARVRNLRQLLSLDLRRSGRAGQHRRAAVRVRQYDTGGAAAASG